MSDTDMELRTNYDAVRYAHDDVLIGGFGLGIVPLAMLRKNVVRSIHIIEKNADVIKASAKPFLKHLSPNERAQITIHHGDVNTWEPAISTRQFNFIYFDIWTDGCVDDVEQMAALHKRYSRWLKRGGKCMSWQYEHLKSLKRAGRWR